MAHAVRGGTPGPAAPAGRPRPAPGRLSPGRLRPGQLRRRWLDLATTPGRLRLLLAGLVLLSLAWGALAAFTAVQYSSAAASVVSTREPLSLDAQQIYGKLSDANDAAATAFLAGGIEPAAGRQRYRSDITAAGGQVEAATAEGEAGTPRAAADLAFLARELPVYTGEIETARADNRLGLPLGAAYLREASTLMRGPLVRGTLLGKAKDLYAAENDSLHTASAQATGLPLVVVTGVAGLLAGLALLLASRWLRGRTNRVLNVGLLAAGAAVVISLAWLGVAYASARGDLLDAQARGSATVQAVAQVGIAAQEAHADEGITLIDNMGDDSYQDDFTAKVKALGPGPGTLLAAAQTAARGTPAAPAVAAAVSDSGTWFTAHARVRSLDNSGNHAKAVTAALGQEAGSDGASFTRLSRDLSAATADDQAVFDSTARSASGAYSGLEAGLIVAALLMAVACAWGLGRRLAEYR
jgi:hypothetical protein